MGVNIEIPDGELFRGQAATLLVEMARRYLPPEVRKIAVGRRKPGQPFVIETEEDVHVANDTETPA